MVWSFSINIYLCIIWELSNYVTSIPYHSLVKLKMLKSPANAACEQLQLMIDIKIITVTCKVMVQFPEHISSSLYYLLLFFSFPIEVWSLNICIVFSVGFLSCVFYHNYAGEEMLMKYSTSYCCSTVAANSRKTQMLFIKSEKDTEKLPHNKTICWLFNSFKAIADICRIQVLCKSTKMFNFCISIIIWNLYNNSTTKEIGITSIKHWKLLKF